LLTELKEKIFKKKYLGRSLTGTPETLLGYSVQKIEIEEEWYGNLPYSNDAIDSITIVYELSQKI
jgi:hypothetical protein